MKVGVLFSGGKDSTLTANMMHEQGFEVELITFFPKNKDSYMLHSASLKPTKIMAEECLGFPYHSFEISGEKEKEVEEMLECIATLKLDGIAAGAIASTYQKQRVEHIAKSLNLKFYAPIWHTKPYNEYSKMKIILSKVAALGLDEKDLGNDALPYLEKYNYFEGGDAETLVLDAPFFKKKLEITYKKHWRKDHGEIEIINAKAIEKT